MRKMFVAKQQHLFCNFILISKIFIIIFAVPLLIANRIETDVFATSKNCWGEKSDCHGPWHCRNRRRDTVAYKENVIRNFL